MTAVVAAMVALSALPQQAPYDSVFERLRNLAPDAIAPVKNVVLKRDAMELRFDSGYAYLLTPVSGRTIGIAFAGAGSLTFQPPLLVEQFNLQRVLGDTGISGPITAAAFVFTDSTAEELKRQLTFESRGLGDLGTARDAVSDALDYLIDDRSHSAPSTLTTALLNQSASGYFAAYVKRARGESVMIEYDPLETEEMALYRRGKMPGQRVETVCRFQRSQDLAANVSETDEHPQLLDVGPYDIDATIEGNLKFSAHATLRLAGRTEPQRWAVFYLYHELDVDSISAGGQALTFYRRDHATPLWVRFPRAIGPGDTLSLRISYHGPLIALSSIMEELIPKEYLRELGPALDSWVDIKSEFLWYPIYSSPERYDMRLTFHTPRNLQFASIGRRVRADTSDKVITTQWITEYPTNTASFNIGKFEEFQIRDPRIPPVTVHINADAHRILQKLIPHSRSGAEDVGSDIANSLSFFTQMFGPPLFHHYYATEAPQSHGAAFPGLVRLSWQTYLSYSTKGSDESFRAHEIAHQWWYYGVEPATYRDAWLSEGFSEFSGLWYMQTVLRDNEKYLKKLRDARDEIRHERGKAAPIGLGTRASESWRGDYSLMTYQKGAWVLHMLRNLLLDINTMREDRFQAMMRDYYTTFRGKRVTTQDFQRMVEKHLGQPMDWFFDEWVYGTAIPTYTLSWKAETDSAGKPALRLRVRQRDVPPGFGMYVPVLIKFQQGEAMVRILVRDTTTNAIIRVPTKPTSVVLNPLESVLADVKTESWSDQ